MFLSIFLPISFPFFSVIEGRAIAIRPLQLRGVKLFRFGVGSPRFAWRNLFPFYQFFMFIYSSFLFVFLFFRVRIYHKYICGAVFSTIRKFDGQKLKKNRNLLQFHLLKRKVRQSQKITNNTTMNILLKYSLK